MIRNFQRIKIFFFILLISNSTFALEPPKPIARPAIKLSLYQDVFDQIKRQQWPMAIKLAENYQNKNLASYIKWLDITRPGSNHSFDYLTSFYKSHKHWPNSKIILEKIESSVSKSVKTQKVLSWFESNPPQTSKGKIDYLEARIKFGKTINKKNIITNIWINSDLTFNQQKYFIRNYSKYWNQSDNWKRFERLIYEGKNISARRTLNRINGDLRKLGEARLGLSRRSGNISSLIKNVPANLKNDPGLIYERMRWRRKAKLNSAADLLLNPPQQIQNVRNWWINSRIIVRRLLNKKEFLTAYKILEKHNLPLTTKSGLEAEWLAGWVAFHHLKSNENAIKHFKNVFNNSDNNFRAKSSYWLALVNIKKNSKKAVINKWLSESSKNKYSFYGQNASLKLGSFDITEKSYLNTKPNKFDDLINVIKIIIESDQKIKKSYPFFKKIFDMTSTDEEKFFILDQANKLADKSIVGKLSKGLNYPSLKYSYPEIIEYIPKKFENSKPTIALIHAIVHQESNFSINAYSSAGARGLMQLMPFTAKKVAKDLRIKYYKNKLTRNPQYNILLGTTYINEMLIKFNKSLPLALAAYNAGPSRVKIWLKRYGDPRQKEISYENWIESIPISETRFYVQKVLSNLRVYQKKYNLNLYR